MTDLAETANIRRDLVPRGAEDQFDTDVIAHHVREVEFRHRRRIDAHAQRGQRAAGLDVGQNADRADAGDDVALGRVSAVWGKEAQGHQDQWRQHGGEMRFQAPGCCGHV